MPQPLALVQRLRDVALGTERVVLRSLTWLSLSLCIPLALSLVVTNRGSGRLMLETRDGAVVCGLSPGVLHFRLLDASTLSDLELRTRRRLEPWGSPNGELALSASPVLFLLAACTFARLRGLRRATGTCPSLSNALSRLRRGLAWVSALAVVVWITALYGWTGSLETQRRPLSFLADRQTLSVLVWEIPPIPSCPAVGPLVHAVPQVATSAACPTWALLVAALAAGGASLTLGRLRRRAGGCTSCGYDLTGNLSGRCPECGTSLRRVALTVWHCSASSVLSRSRRMPECCESRGYPRAGLPGHTCPECVHLNCG
jgi:hypothetical protein